MHKDDEDVVPNELPCALRLSKIRQYINQRNEPNYHITKTRLFKCIENFTTKNWKLSGEKFW